MRRIFRGQASIFAFSGSNALVRVLSHGAPRVVENQIDAKKVSPESLAAPDGPSFMRPSETFLNLSLPVVESSRLTASFDEGNNPDLRFWEDFGTPPFTNGNVTLVNGTLWRGE
jgi:hypothetical protein